MSTPVAVLLLIRLRIATRCASPAKPVNPFTMPPPSLPLLPLTSQLTSSKLETSNELTAKLAMPPLGPLQELPVIEQLTSVVDTKLPWKLPTSWATMPIPPAPNWAKLPLMVQSVTALDTNKNELEK